MNWQPIETCPRDGSCFLVWVHAETHGENDEGFPTVADNSYADIGWWRAGTDPVLYGYVDFGGQNTHHVDEPEYWMPLPPPPSWRTASGE